MEITILIFEQMIKFFLLLVMGYMLVKMKLVHTDESRTLTVVLVYLVSPCVIINSFLIEYTEETIKGLILAFVVAIAIHVLFLLIIKIFGKVCKLNAIEKASVMYSNAGNSLKKCFINRRIYLIAFLRLCVCPVLVLLMMGMSGVTRLLPDAPTVMFVSFLACTTPTSVTTTQLALLYRKDAAYSTAINIVSTVCSMVTIPLMSILYWKMIG